MRMRIGKVTNIYPATGKVQVMYEDEGNASLPLSMLTMNLEYSMPAVGDRVVTMHMENGSSKGFVMGTYYGGGMQPKANSGYRKDFEGGAYVICAGGVYQLFAGSVSIKGSSKVSISGGGSATVYGGGAALALNGDAALVGGNVTIGSASASEDGDSGGTEPDVYLKITADTAELKAVSAIKLLSDADIEAKAVNILIEADADVLIKAAGFMMEADTVTMQCSYGTITVEDMMKRLERLEDQLGLPHTV